MKIKHSPYHWLVVALVLVAVLLTLSDAHGQAAGAQGGVAAVDADTTSDKSLRKKDIAPAQDHSIAKDQRSAVKAAKRAIKRTISRARHGNSEIDSQAKAGN